MGRASLWWSNINPSTFQPGFLAGLAELAPSRQHRKTPNNHHCGSQYMHILHLVSYIMLCSDASHLRRIQDHAEVPQKHGFASDDLCAPMTCSGCNTCIFQYQNAPHPHPSRLCARPTRVAHGISTGESASSRPLAAAERERRQIVHATLPSNGCIDWRHWHAVSGASIGGIRCRIARSIASLLASVVAVCLTMVVA